jgi:hypothetical protein
VPQGGHVETLVRGSRRHYLAAHQRMTQWFGLNRVKPVSLLIAGVLAWALYWNLSISLRIAYHQLAFIKDHPTLSYEDKMRRKLWPLGFDFTVFVKDHSPEDSVILIPPQRDSIWLFTGNRPVFSYFVYPRRVVNGPSDVSPAAILQFLELHPEITHVIITSERRLWPDVLFSPRDKVMLFDVGWGLVALGR